jgi:hypothetical protein
MARAPESLVAKRLGVLPGDVVAVVSAPEGFRDSLTLPVGARLRTSARGRVAVLLFFATRRAELGRRLPAMARAVERDGGLWIAWPRRTSGVASDLSEAQVGEIGRVHGLVVAGVVPIGDGWSGVRLVRRVRSRAVS